MSLLMKFTSILVFLLALVNCVAADYYYVGSTVGGIVGLVSSHSWSSFWTIFVFFSFVKRLSSFWISSQQWKSSNQEGHWLKNFSGSYSLSSVLLLVCLDLSSYSHVLFHYARLLFLSTGLVVYLLCGRPRSGGL